MKDCKIYCGIKILGACLFILAIIAFIVGRYESRPKYAVGDCFRIDGTVQKVLTVGKYSYRTRGTGATTYLSNIKVIDSVAEPMDCWDDLDGNH